MYNNLEIINDVTVQSIKSIDDAKALLKEMAVSSTPIEYREGKRFKVLYLNEDIGICTIQVLETNTDRTFSIDSLAKLLFKQRAELNAGLSKYAEQAYLTAQYMVFLNGKLIGKANDTRKLLAQVGKSLNQYARACWGIKQPGGAVRALCMFGKTKTTAGGLNVDFEKEGVHRVVAYARRA